MLLGEDTMAHTKITIIEVGRCMATTQQSLRKRELRTKSNFLLLRNIHPKELNYNLKKIKKRTLLLLPNDDEYYYTLQKADGINLMKIKIRFSFHLHLI
jgi:hypothetical protein